MVRLPDRCGTAMKYIIALILALNLVLRTTEAIKFPNAYSPILKSTCFLVNKNLSQFQSSQQNLETLQKLRGGNVKKDEKEQNEEDIAKNDEEDDEDESENESEIDSSSEELEYFGDDDVESDQVHEMEDDYEDEDEEDVRDEVLVEEVEDENDSQSNKDIIEGADTEFDQLIPASPIQQMAVSMGVMYISRKIDFNDPKVVRWARIAFLLYILATQAFLIYVRIAANRNNDRTPISMPTNPLLSSLLPSNTPPIAKDIASKLLASQSTIMEYDLAQANQMNNGLLFPLIFMWFIHYKMGQVQPLLYQASSGFFNLLNSPLWQVYIRGRNLERPWKTVEMPPKEDVEGSDDDESNLSDTTTD